MTDALRPTLLRPAVLRPALLLALTLLPLGVSACGFGGEVDRDEPATVEFAPAAQAQDYGDTDWSRSSRGSQPQLDASDAVALLSVPPQRALLRVRAVVSGADRADVVRRLTTESQALAESIAAEERCAGAVTQMMPAQRVGDAHWQSSTELDVTVRLEGLGTVAERHARIEACLARIGSSFDGREGLRVFVGAPLLTLDDPGHYRAELLRRALRPAAEVQATADEGALPPQFDPMALRCRSAGQVAIVGRSLSGIGLSVDLACDARAPVSPPAAPPAA